MRKQAILLILIICATLLSGCKVHSYTKNTKFPGPRYFDGRVSEGEIYAGTIIALLGASREGPPWSIIYLKRTLRGKEQKQLPKYVEQLVYKPLRPVAYQEEGRKVEKRWPVNRPIKRVADSRSIWPKGARGSINNGTYVELGLVKRAGDHVEVHGENSFGALAAELVDFEVTLSNGRLIFNAVEIYMVSSENRKLSKNITIDDE